MMSLVGRQPVLWVNLGSLLASGPYTENNMRQWNHALLRACASHPDMRVYDWAAAVKPSWFISDGTHYTSAGYALRAHLIARALAAAFPAHAAAATPAPFKPGTAGRHHSASSASRSALADSSLNPEIGVQPRLLGTDFRVRAERSPMRCCRLSRRSPSRKARSSSGTRHRWWGCRRLLSSSCRAPATTPAGR